MNPVVYHVPDVSSDMDIIVKIYRSNTIDTWCGMRRNWTYTIEWGNRDNRHIYDAYPHGEQISTPPYKSDFDEVFRTLVSFAYDAQESTGSAANGASPEFRAMSDACANALEMYAYCEMSGD